MQAKSLVHLIYNQDDPWGPPRLARLASPIRAWSMGAQSARRVIGEAPPVNRGSIAGRVAPGASELAAGNVGNVENLGNAKHVDHEKDSLPAIAKACRQDILPDTSDLPATDALDIPAAGGAEFANSAVGGDLPDDREPAPDDILAQLAWESERIVRDAGSRSAQQHRFSCAVLPRKPAPVPLDDGGQSAIESGAPVADMLEGQGTIDQLLAGLDAAGADEFLQPESEPELLQWFMNDRKTS